jgi:hypothetical protein
MELTLDFSRLTLPNVAKAQTDPFKIFSALPRLPDAPNDLWRGQAQALTDWNETRDAPDTLISLNTGAGKTLVGLLIAKSFCNEGLENVLYVCPTNDLVNQTAQQAKRAGIDFTTRVGSSFSNDLFETGKAFCITNYHSILNGFSSLRRKHFPEAIIFDDAHVAESMMRSAYTLRFAKHDHKDLFNQIAAMYTPHFQELGAEARLADACTELLMASSLLVPPQISIRTGAQLEALLRSGGVLDDANLKFAFAHLKDKFDKCAVVISNGIIEITPPFLPALSMDIFAQRVRRVYLSATLHNKADIVRAFGRQPGRIIEPDNDAGNGERLIVFERTLSGPINPSFVSDLVADHKVVLAVPSYRAAAQWKDVATAPSTEEFTEKLDGFRAAKTGTFLLVSRVDGIDLPHDTCRLMVIDGVPTGESLLEKYQFNFLHMKSFAASRTANRLVQLFGRINRGRSDYGAFLIAGHPLNVWLNTDKNVALLPNLLKNQILLGRHVQEGMRIKSTADVKSLLNTVLLSIPRNQGWLDYYSQFLDASDIPEETTERAMKAEARNLEAAKAEALYAKMIWEGNFEEAREALDSSVAETARADDKLAGWHNLWIAATLHFDGHDEDAYYYNAQARGQLGPNLLVYTGPIGSAEQQSIAGQSPIVERLFRVVNLGRESFTKQLQKLVVALQPLEGGSPRQMEEAVRVLGELLGFISSRPDNEFGTGPDVLWVDERSKSLLGIELKTDKGEGSTYSKDDVSQSMDHLSWISNNSESRESLGVVLIGEPVKASNQANPVDAIFWNRPAFLVALRDRILALLSDVYKLTPLQRLDALDSATASGWSLRDISIDLCGNSLK